eukprot:gene4102-5852_t
MDFVNKFSAFFVSFPYYSNSLFRYSTKEDLEFNGEKFGGVFMVSDEKNAICKSIEETMPRKFISNYLGISLGRMVKMMKIYHSGKPFSDDNVHLNKLDTQAYIDLPELVKKKEKEQKNPIVRSQLIDIIQHLAVQTDLRRGGNGINVKIVDSRTIDRIIKDSRVLRCEKGQSTTMARNRESLDVRNFWVTHVMNECYAENKDPHLI